MPTAPKLFAALALAAVCYLTAELIRPYLPPGTQVGAFVPMSGLVGLYAGWRVIGSDMGRGSWAAVLAGLRGAVFAGVAGLILFSIVEMLTIAWRGNYDGPFEAVLGIVDLAAKYLPVLVKPDVLAALFGGSVLAALLGEWASRRWT